MSRRIAVCLLAAFCALSAFANWNPIYSVCFRLRNWRTPYERFAVSIHPAFLVAEAWGWSGALYRPLPGQSTLVGSFVEVDATLRRSGESRRGGGIIIAEAGNGFAVRDPFSRKVEDFFQERNRLNRVNVRPSIAGFREDFELPSSGESRMKKGVPYFGIVSYLAIDERPPWQIAFGQITVDHEGQRNLIQTDGKVLVVLPNHTARIWYAPFTSRLRRELQEFWNLTTLEIERLESLEPFTY